MNCFKYQSFTAVDVVGNLWAHFMIVLQNNQIQLNNDGLVITEEKDIPIQLNVNIPSVSTSNFIS
jgi:hypothetical protein